MLIKRRLIFIAIVSFVGGFLFIPFFIANKPTLKGIDLFEGISVFIGLSTIITVLTAWIGLKLSDRLNINMPILRNWEMGRTINRIEIKSLLAKSILIGFIIAAITLIGNQFISTPTNPGGFFTRISTTIWASFVTETISHLFILSGLIILIKNKWGSLIISSLIFVVLFHLNSNYVLTTTIYLGTINFVAITITGYLFIKLGFEYAILTHMIMHFILLAINK